MLDCEGFESSNQFWSTYISSSFAQMCRSSSCWTCCSKNNRWCLWGARRISERAPSRLELQQLSSSCSSSGTLMPRESFVVIIVCNFPCASSSPSLRRATNHDCLVSRSYSPRFNRAAGDHPASTNHCDLVPRSGRVYLRSFRCQLSVIGW